MENLLQSESVNSAELYDIVPPALVPTGYEHITAIVWLKEPDADVYYPAPSAAPQYWSLPVHSPAPTSRELIRDFGQHFSDAQIAAAMRSAHPAKLLAEILSEIITETLAGE